MKNQGFGMLLVFVITVVSVTLGFIGDFTDNETLIVIWFLGLNLASSIFVGLYIGDFLFDERNEND